MHRTRVDFTIVYIFLVYLLIAGCSQEKDEPAGNVSNDNHLEVCTFNIRFDNPADGFNSWTNRRKDVVNFLVIEEPDIIGMQEVLNSQLHYLKDRLNEYNKIGIGRDDGKDAGEFAPIFYKIQRFELLDSGTFWLSETPEVPSIGWDALIKRICTYGLFLDKVSGEEIHFYNTHYSHVGETARLRSTELILDSIQSKSENVRVILTGDLNTEPNTKPYDLIIENGLSDSYFSNIIFGPAGTYNGFKSLGPFGRRIDYIFSRGFDSKIYVCHSMLIDNRYISDHFPVISKLEYADLE